jgi:hypothetical protein
LIDWMIELMIDWLNCCYPKIEFYKSTLQILGLHSYCRIV